MAKKGILLIGGCGFIGSNLARRFVRSGEYNVVVFEAPLAPETRLSEVRDSVVVLHGNLENVASFEAILRQYEIGTVVHLVSGLLPNSPLKDYQKEIEKVIKPTIDIIHICAKKGIRFVYFSSGGAIYGNNGNLKHREEDTLAPISYYGLSKCNVENVITIENRRNSLPFLILRPSNPYGHGQNLMGKQGIIAVAIGKLLRGESLQMFGDGNNVRDYIYIDDLVEYVFQLISRDAPDGIYNVGSGKGYSNQEVLSVIEKESGRNLNVVNMESRKGDVSSVILDISKLLGHTALEPTGLEEGIRIFWEESNR